MIAVRKFSIIGIVWASVVTPVAAQLEGTPRRSTEFAEIERNIRYNWSKVNSLMADVVVKDLNEEGEVMGQAGGTYEYRRGDRKAMSRMTLKASSTVDQDGKRRSVPVTYTTYNDGSFAHIVHQRGDVVSVTKAFADTQPTMDTHAILFVLKTTSFMELLPDETVNGEETYVIGGTSMAPLPEAARQVVYFSKNTGVILKTVTFNTDGKPVGTYELSKVRINIDVPKERFVVNVPKNAVMQDQTGTSQPYP